MIRCTPAILFLCIFSIQCLAEDALWKEKLSHALKADADGQTDEAERVFQLLLKNHENEGEVWVAYAEHLRFYVHDFDRSAKAFERALRIPSLNDSNRAFAHRGIGELAVKAEKFEKAKEHFQASLRIEPLVDTHRSLCHLYCREKNYPAALEQARAGLAIDPNDAISLLLHAILLQRNSQAFEAKAAYLKAAQLSGLQASEKDPAITVHCCVVYNAAGYLSVRGDRVEAMKMLTRFLENPNHRHLTWEEIESDSDFDNIRTDPSFAKLKNQYFVTPQK